MSGARGRRELALAVLLCLAGAAAVLVANGETWVEVAVRRSASTSGEPAGFVLLGGSLSGRELIDVPTAFGLVGLAGVVAIAATRRWGRVLTGAVLLVAGAAVCGATLRFRGDALAYARSTEFVRTTLGSPVLLQDEHLSVTAWSAVAFAGGVLIAAAGLLVAARGAHWPVLGARYASPAEGPVSRDPADDDIALWDALDRGDDTPA